LFFVRLTAPNDAAISFVAAMTDRAALLAAREVAAELRER